MNWTTFFPHLFLLLLAPSPAVMQGKQTVLGEVKGKAELSCSGSQKKNMPFSWKQSSNIKILGNQGGFSIKGTSTMKDRVESKRMMWDQGSFPLIITNLQWGDTGTYICEVGDKKTQVQLLVFKLTARPNSRIVVGQNLTLTLESPPGGNPSVQWEAPGTKGAKGIKNFSVSSVGLQNKGTWKCIISQDKATLSMEMKIMVLDFQEFPDIVYKKEEEQVKLSFPLNFQAEHLNGNLLWQAEGASLQVKFSVKNSKVSVENSSQHLKFQMQDTLPLSLTLPQALSQLGGSGTLTLNLEEGVLQRKVKLVVMRVSNSHNNVTCEVKGPVPPKLKLTLKLQNQSEKISNQQKLVMIPDPKAGIWQCLLSDGDHILLKHEVEVSPQFTKPSPTFLAFVLGGIAGLLLLIGFCSFCCVKCWHRKRQAERMSQIKRLLSEKKTCQCPHRKTCGLI